MDSQMLIIIVSLLLVLVVTGMIAFLVANGKSSQKKHVMSVIKGTNSEQVNKKSANIDTRREGLSRKLKESGTEDKKEKEGKSLADSIVYAGLDISIKQTIYRH